MARSNSFIAFSPGVSLNVNDGATFIFMIFGICIHPRKCDWNCKRQASPNQSL